MNEMRILMITLIAVTLVACGSNTEPSQGTGQGDGVSTIDSTKSEEQMDGTKAPGYSGDSNAISDTSRR